MVTSKAKIVKIKANSKRLGVIFLMLVLVVPSLFSAFKPTPVAAVAASGLPTVYGNSSLLCAPEISGPEPGDGAFGTVMDASNTLNAQSQMYNLSQGIAGEPSAETAVFKAMFNKQNVMVIDFVGANGATNSNNLCGGSMALFREVGASDQNTFYGVWGCANASLDQSGGNTLCPQGHGPQYKLVSGAVDPIKKTLSFGLPNGVKGTVAFTGDTSVLANSQFFATGSGGGSGGSASSGMSLSTCIATYQQSGIQQPCLDGKTASFSDWAHISFDGETYTAGRWAGSHIYYTLDTSSDSVLAGMSPKFDINTDSDNGQTDFNIDGDGTDPAQLTQLRNALTRQGLQGTLQITYDVDSTNGNVKTTMAGVDTVANYYPDASDPAKDIVQLVFTNGAGGNENHFYGTYSRAGATSSTFTLTGSGAGYSGCGSGKQPRFIVTSRPGTTPGDGAANWYLQANDTACDEVVIPVVMHFEKAGTAPPTIGTTSTTPSGSSTPNCEISGSPLTWILCPVFNIISDGAHAIFQYVVQPFLITPPVSTDPHDPGFQIWSNFRVYGDIFLLIALLVIVFGQSIGGGLVDAYTAKKVLPRLLAAAILINLSIYIVALLVDITNVIGAGIGSLLTTPIRQCTTGAGNCWDFHLSAGDQLGVFSVGFIGLLATLGGLVGFFGVLFAGGIGAILMTVFFTALPMIFAVLAVFITLVIRKGLILFLLVTSPVAFALYCLPNTEKYFRKWWDLLLESLMVYPIIVAIFAVADVLSITLLNSNGITPDSLQSGSNFFAGHLDRVIALVVAFLLQFIPLLLIPFAFRFASGALKRVYDVATGTGARINEAVKPRKQQAKADYQAQALARRGDLYHKLNGRGGAVGRFAARRVGGYNIEAALSAGRAEKAKQLNDQIATGRDEEIRGLSVNKKWAMRQAAFGAVQTDADGKRFRTNGQVREYLDGNDNVTKRDFMSLGGAWINENDVDAGHARWGKDTFAQQASLAYEMRKAQSEGQLKNLATNYKNVAQGAGGWGNTDSEAAGSWIGAAFEHQNQHLEYKYTDWQTGNLSKADDYVDEIYEKKGSYPLAQMSSNSIERLITAYNDPSADDTRRQKIASIAESFMHEFGAGGQQIGEATGQEQRPIITTADDEVSGRKQASVQGAAHVAERVRELAVLTGRYNPGAPPPGTPPAPPQR